MKSVMIGILVMIVFSAIAWGVMGKLSEPSSDAYRSQDVRLN